MAAVDKGADREMENVSFLEEAVGDFLVILVSYRGIKDIVRSGDVSLVGIDIILIALVGSWGRQLISFVF